MIFLYLLSGHWLLIAAAILPALFLVRTVYRADRLEKESPRMIGTLIVFGIISTVIAMVLEYIGSMLLEGIEKSDPGLWRVLMYFGVVAFSEEGAKYFLLRRRTWRNPEFNCQFDGVVYAVSVSLGFALWENIGYAARYGLSTALLRALTAVPGHACFGVFMGVWYGAAKRFHRLGDARMKRLCGVFSVLIPAVLHGTYDYLATAQTNHEWTFIVFVAAMFLYAWRTVRKRAEKDRYI